MDMDIGDKVLLVEDEVMNSMYLAAQLGQMGFSSVKCVFTCEEAIACAEREKPDIVLMDINLRGAMSGIEAARRMKILRDTPIIFLSGYADPKTEAEALNPLAFLVKPIDLRELRRLMVCALASPDPRLSKRASSK